MNQTVTIDRECAIIPLADLNELKRELDLLRTSKFLKYVTTYEHYGSHSRETTIFADTEWGAEREIENKIKNLQLSHNKEVRDLNTAIQSLRKERDTAIETMLEERKKASKPWYRFW